MSSPSPNNITILVIDDDKMIVHAVQKRLEKAGYKILTAFDGHEGALKVRQEQPDLIILDVMMPNVDGWTFIKQLRASAQYSLIPVIFLTALAKAEDRLKGFQLGADDYLTKPFKPEELEYRVQNVLKRFRKITERFNLKPKGVSHDKKLPSSAGFTGQLEQLGISTIFTVVSMEQKTGQLMVIDSLGTEKAQVFFRDGRPVCAAVEGKPGIEHQEVIFYLLTWKKGQFAFKNQEVEIEDQIQLTMTDLLLEGARRMDEASR